MPDATVGAVAGEHLGQRGVGRVTLRDAGTLVDRRAHERVPEPDLLLSDIDEPNDHRRVSGRPR